MLQEIARFPVLLWEAGHKKPLTARDVPPQEDHPGANPEGLHHSIPGFPEGQTVRGMPIP